MDKLELSDAVSEIFNLLRLSNKYIDDTTPWVLAKDESNKDRLETVLYNLLESIRVCSILLQPVMPDTYSKIFDQLNINDNSFNFNDSNNYKLNKASILFQRIDKSEFDL